MSATKRVPREPFAAASSVEPSSWWPFVAIVLGALGCYGLLAVHLLLDATNADVWGLAWMAVPSAFIAGSVAAMLIASGMPLRERLAAIPAALLGYSPRRRSRPSSIPPSREPA